VTLPSGILTAEAQKDAEAAANRERHVTVTTSLVFMMSPLDVALNEDFVT
jgi:hypothetical protein